MYKKKCRCGKSEKNFKFNIGPFFVAECCIAAGYDELGNKAGEETPKPEPKPETNKKTPVNKLDLLTKRELAMMAVKSGIRVEKGMTKEDLIDAIQGKDEKDEGGSGS